MPAPDEEQAAFLAAGDGPGAARVSNASVARLAPTLVRTKKGIVLAVVLLLAIVLLLAGKGAAPTAEGHAGHEEGDGDEATPDGYTYSHESHDSNDSDVAQSSPSTLAPDIHDDTHDVANNTKTDHAADENSNGDDLALLLDNSFAANASAAPLASVDCRQFTALERMQGTLEHRIKRADCGLGYNVSDSPARHKPWKVTLLGSQWTGPVLKQSGCPLGTGKCPLSPKCTIGISSSPGSAAQYSDVLVIFQKEARKLVPQIKTHRSNDSMAKPHRVLYWREAHWESATDKEQDEWFDFEMGVHAYSGILNPNFLFGPTAMRNAAVPGQGHIPFVPIAKRTHLAMSMISDCDTVSYRRAYLERLSSALGRDRMHQYGGCGNMKLPPKPVYRAAQVISGYKFFMAFENTIMPGYVTEKLSIVLMFNVVPVYYGALDAPNITKTPSYIRASDFKTPELLAKYLLYLDANPDQYMKYHAWRSDPNSFTDEYLDTCTYRVPGPIEMESYPRADSGMASKAAGCCRLCDENAVRRARQWTAEHYHPVGSFWSPAKIAEQFFGGAIHG